MCSIADVTLNRPGDHSLSRGADASPGRVATLGMRTSPLEGCPGQENIWVLQTSAWFVAAPATFQGELMNEPSVCVFACVWSRGLGREEPPKLAEASVSQ